MDDVRLTATNPADSSIVPVACNDKGEILLEEPIEGPPGQDGQDGQDSDMMLPPDPYEGALLGWLNNQLAWIGTPPVPIPEGVFGPIISWDKQASYLEVEGDIPETVGGGVYVYQCDERGDYFTDGWETSQEWSSYGSSDNVDGALFDGSLDTYGGATFEYNFGTDGPTAVESIEVAFDTSAAYSNTVTINGSINLTDYTGGLKVFVDVTAQVGLGRIDTIVGTYSGGSATGLLGIKVDGKLLVDSDKSLNLRVNQRFMDGLLGTPNVDIDFTPGKYLFVPEQRVAPWVLYKGDPTSRIDYLRQTRD